MGFDIQIDFRSGEPIYTQIVNQIQQMVAEGELKQGDQLPTVRHLATELRVNFNTVARAYRILDEAGLISTQQGRGTYIWEQPDEAKIFKLRRQSLKDLILHRFQEAQQLGYEVDEVEATSDELIRRWKTNGSLND
ncbi:MAG TPA: GntR family transcriptional regulator [Anaerolineales bacterium]|jgi:GntR family transcriptional regulator|nr:GntR family transcriptional regulator [Anaerolineales bacterium]